MTEKPEPHGSIEMADQLEHLFRHQSGKMISALTRILGVHNLALAEDIVQETLLKALQTWPFHPPVKKPEAWLMTAAKNKAIDTIRREKHRQKFAQAADPLLRTEWTLAATVGRSFSEDGMEDSQLRMMFVCCHPGLPRKTQIALTLRLLCGLGPGEIAAALLMTEAAVRKMLYRGKQQLRAARVTFEMPKHTERMARLDVVLTVLYLMFNDGYNASKNVSLIRKDLCADALRLTHLLCNHSQFRIPKVLALAALMCFHSARLPARVNQEGNQILLEQQDRRLWDQKMIAKGFQLLTASGSGEQLSSYHLEAGIAAVHCQAADFSLTDWERILGFYDQLVQCDPSPVVALNRAIALRYVSGPKAALRALRALEGQAQLQNYHRLPATLGEISCQLGDWKSGERYFATAFQQVSSPVERAFLQQKIEQCRSHIS